MFPRFVPFSTLAKAFSAPPAKQKFAIAWQSLNAMFQITNDLVCDSPENPGYQDEIFQEFLRLLNSGGEATSSLAQQLNNKKSIALNTLAIHVGEHGETMIYVEYTHADRKGKRTPHAALCFEKFECEQIGNLAEICTVPHFMMNGELKTRQSGESVLEIDDMRCRVFHQGEYKYFVPEKPTEYYAALAYANSFFLQMMRNGDVQLEENQKWILDPQNYRDAINFVNNLSRRPLNAALKEFVIG